MVLCWWDGSWMVTCACLCGCVVVFAGAVGAAAAGLFLRKVVPLRRETAAREGASGIARVEGLIAVTKKNKNARLDLEPTATRDKLITGMRVLYR